MCLARSQGMQILKTTILELRGSTMLDLWLYWASLMKNKKIGSCDLANEGHWSGQPGFRASQRQSDLSLR